MPSEHISQFYIRLNGSPLLERDYNALMMAEVDDSLYMPDMFTLQFRDEGLRLITEDMFKPGDTIEVLAKASGEQAQTVTLIDGEITSVEPDINSNDRGTLIVRGFDRMHRLTRGRTTRTFLNMTDSDVVRQLAMMAGLMVGEIDATTVVHEFLMQSNQTDLEYILERAKRIGYQVYVEGRRLNFKKTPSAPPAGPELDWGITLDRFQGRVSTMEQVNEVVVRGWDPASKREVVGRATNPTNATQHRTHNGKHGGAQAQSAHSVRATQTIVDRPVTNMAEAEKIAQAELDAREANFIQAEGDAGGNPGIKAGYSVDIKGVGTRFGGKYLVTRSVHRYTAKGYSTHFWCNGGKSTLSLLGLITSSTGHNTVNAVGAQEHVTARGVLIGLVTDNMDPMNLGRVRVKIPVLDTEAWWCRLATIMAGPTQGVAYFPEVNDEVIVAFENGDPSRGVVLGSVWNASDNTPKPIGELVAGGQTIRRVIKTRRGILVILDDQPGTEGIYLIDKKGTNFIKILTDTDEIQIECMKNITIKSTTGNITAQTQSGDIMVQTSTGSMKLQSLGDMELSATGGKVKITGTAGVEINTPAQAKVTAGATLDLTAAGVTSIKGAIVKLN